VIECFLTDKTGTHAIEEPEAGCWVNVTSPTAEDRAWLEEELGVIDEFVKSALDDEETSHVDYDEDTGQTLVIIDCPFIEDAAEAEDPLMTQYDTHPLTVLFLRAQDMIVTISLKENPTLSLFAVGKIADFNTHQRTRFLLQIFSNTVQRYLRYLRSINRQFTKNEKILHQTMRNSELVKMLGLEKSLVYFSTSLRGDETTLSRIQSGRVVQLYEDDKDLLDDVFIEIRQAIEMCTVYSSILNGTMDTFSSVISNNLNLVMRTLTIVTIVLAIPTIIFSFYGMNVEGLPLTNTCLLPLGLAVVGMAGAILYFRTNNLFK
jgi:magnesium transporter